MMGPLSCAASGRWAGTGDTEPKGVPMRFRDKTPEQASADALRMAERKQAEGCSPCADAYRGLAKDPRRRRLLGRALLGAGALTATSLLDVGGVLAGSPRANGTATAKPLGSAEADRWARTVQSHADVRSLVTFLEGRGQRPTSHEALALTHNGEAVGTAVILRYGPDAFVLVGATDSGPVRAGAVHGSQAFVVRGGVVTVDPETTAKLASVQHAAPLPGSALHSVIGAGVAQAACSLCNVYAAGCGFFTGCCFTGNVPCCPFGAAFCVQFLN